MADYNPYRTNERDEENNGRYRGYSQGSYETHSRDRYGKPYDDSVNRGFSSYGSSVENPYRDERYFPADYYQGNFTGSNYDRDFDFGMNRRGGQQRYGKYNSLDYDDIDRRHAWRPANQRSYMREAYHPNDLGVGSNYAYNRGGYGSNFGGEYGRFPNDQGYASEWGGPSYAHSRRGGGYDPDRRYSSYSGRFDSDYGRRWEHDNRDWFDKAKDEVSSWFGDEDADRRRRMDKGEFRGRGPKNYKRSDSRIHEDISDRMSEDGWVDATDVEVSVKEGEVELRGTVPDRFSKRRAEDIAESVSGVRNVENRIRVSQQDIPMAASDGIASGQQSVSGAPRAQGNRDTNKADKESQR